MGFYVGYRLRVMLTAAIHAKLLRLNYSAIAKTTTGVCVILCSALMVDVLAGQIVNLASNDVKRFEQLGTMWFFLFVGPLEGIFTLAVVTHILGIVPAMAGMSCILMVIPIQVTLLSTHFSALKAFCSLSCRNT